MYTLPLAKYDDTPANSNSSSAPVITEAHEEESDAQLLPSLPPKPPSTMAPPPPPPLPRGLSAVEEWEARVAAPRRVAAAAKAAVLAKAETDRKAAEARAAEVAALAFHANPYWRSVGKSDAVQTLHTLQLFTAREQRHLQLDADFLDSVKVDKVRDTLTSKKVSSPLLVTRRRAAVDAFVAERSRRRA